MKTWTTQPTEKITINDVNIIIDDLPDDIKFEIETYDRLKSDYKDCLYEQTKLKLALDAQFTKVIDKVTKHTSLNTTQEI